MAMLEELNAQGATIIVITHDRELATQFPRRVEILDGRIVNDTGGRDTGPLDSTAHLADEGVR